MKVFLYLLFIGLFFLDGLVFKLLWSWFLVPLGLMELTYAHSLGIVLLLSLVVYKAPEEDKSDEVWLYKGSLSLITCVAVLVIGYLINFFM